MCPLHPLAFAPPANTKIDVISRISMTLRYLNHDARFYRRRGTSRYVTVRHGNVAGHIVDSSLRTYIAVTCDLCGIWGDSVGLVTGHGKTTEQSRFDPRQGQNIYSLSRNLHIGRGAQPPRKWISGRYSPSRSGRKLIAHPHQVSSLNMSG